MHLCIHLPVIHEASRIRIVQFEGFFYFHLFLSVCLSASLSVSASLSHSFSSLSPSLFPLPLHCSVQSCPTCFCDAPHFSQKSFIRQLCKHRPRNLHEILRDQPPGLPLLALVFFFTLRNHTHGLSPGVARSSASSGTAASYAFRERVTRALGDAAVSLPVEYPFMFCALPLILLLTWLMSGICSSFISTRALVARALPFLIGFL